jgi:hypothetical protein
MAKKSSVRSTSKPSKALRPSLGTPAEIRKIQERLVLTAGTVSVLSMQRLPVPSHPPSPGVWRDLATRFERLLSLNEYTNEELWSALNDAKEHAALCYSELAHFGIELCGRKPSEHDRELRSNIARYNEVAIEQDSEGRRRIPTASEYAGSWGNAQTTWGFMVRGIGERYPTRAPLGHMEPWTLDHYCADHHRLVQARPSLRPNIERNNLRVMCEVQAVACRIIAEELDAANNSTGHREQRIGTTTAPQPGSPRKRRRRSPGAPRPLTKLEVETVDVVRRNGLNISAAARELKKNRKTVQENYNRAQSKLTNALGATSRSVRARTKGPDKRGTQDFADKSDERDE